MRVVYEDGAVAGVVLSERNLRVLLAKLERPDSARTLGAPQSNPFFVSAERDDEHYNHPHRPADIRGVAGAVYPADAAVAGVRAEGL